MYGGADYESGVGAGTAFSFSEKTIRMAFIRLLLAVVIHFVKVFMLNLYSFSL